MLKTHSFKNFAVDGIEETYNMKVSVSDYVLKITMIDESGKTTTKYLLEESSKGITKEEANNYLNQYFEMSMQLEEI